jgi:hypothetical protein
VAEPLGFAKEALERGERILAPEAVEIEMTLYREIPAFEAGEISAAFLGRGAFDSLPGGEGIDLAPAGDEVGERGEGFRFFIGAPGKLDGCGKAERRSTPAQGANALHFHHEGFFIREVRRETGGRRLPSRGRERVSVQKIFQDRERPMARPRRHGHGPHCASARFGNQCLRSAEDGI